MEYKKVLKRKLYPTWISSTKIRGYKIHIFQMPIMEYYHYQIVFDNYIFYCSLDNGLKFDGFKECCESAEQYINKIGK